MKTVTVFLFVIMFAFVGQSCFTTGLQDSYVIEIQDIESRNYFYHYTDSTNWLEHISETNTIVMDSGVKYAFDLQFVDTVLRIAETNNHAILWQSAYAIGESYDGAELNSNMKSVSIKTVYDFDPKHLETSDVTAYFTLNGASSETFVSVFNRNLNGSTYYPPLRYNPVLVLNNRPTMSKTASFIVKIEFEDGTAVSCTTDPVTIK
ncbi:MAG: hypothetical protein ACI9JN_002075 [Bacteroidia bacterium]|jgi:hypothetical protein